MKKTIMLATGALLSAGFAATDASAVEVEMYGQVNKGVLHIDGDDSAETSIVDNDHSSTRMGVKGEQMLDNGLTASVLFEFQSESNTSAAAGTGDNDTDANGADASGITERHSRVGLAGNFGAVFLGHTSVVTDGIAEIDLAGAGDVMNASIDKIGGGFAVGVSSTATDITFADAYDSFDGSRTNLVSYMTPVVNGFQGAAHMDEVGNVAAAVRYAGKYNEYHVKAGVAYEMKNEAETTGFDAEDLVVGSASVKHDSGLAATVSYGVQSYKESSRDDATNTYVKLGYEMDALELAVDYALSENMSNEGDELTSYGLGAQYNLGHGVSVAGLYRTIEFSTDQLGFDEQDADMFMANLRVKF